MKIYWIARSRGNSIFHFWYKNKDFKTAAVALTQVENILLANVFEIENQLAKSLHNKPSLIFIKQ